MFLHASQHSAAVSFLLDGPQVPPTTSPHILRARGRCARLQVGRAQVGAVAVSVRERAALEFDA